MVDVADWKWAPLHELQPGQHVLYKGSELKIKSIEAGRWKSSLKVRFYGAPAIDLTRDTELRVVHKST